MLLIDSVVFCLASHTQVPDQTTLMLQFLVNTLSWYYALNGINILLVIARILNLMHFQPRLGVVTRSLLLAGPDLLHFTVVAGIVFVGYAMMAHVIFGNVIEKFSSFRLSIDTCFEMLLGEISVNEDLKALTGLQVHPCIFITP